MCPIHVMTVDDHPVVLEGLKEILRAEPEIELCAEARSGEEALNKLPQISPDIVMMDIHMPGMGGLEATRQIHRLFPKVKVIILTVDAKQHLVQAIEAGAQGYLIKDAKQADLIQTVRSVYSGQNMLSSSSSLRISSLIPGALKRLSLTPRQHQIIHMVASGIANKAIAYHLHLSDTTIKREMRSIFDKLGATDRAEAVSLAYQQGLLQ